MTVYAITDTKKGRTGIAPTYLHTTHNLLIRECYRSCNTDIVGHENEVELRKVITEVSNTDFVLMGNFNYPDIDWVHTVTL